MACQVLVVVSVAPQRALSDVVDGVHMMLNVIDALGGLTNPVGQVVGLLVIAAIAGVADAVRTIRLDVDDSTVAD